MPVTDVTTDPESLTMTLTAEFAAPVERLWQAFTDPRQLERFWGPPGWPATFTEFDLVVGSVVRYHMTSPTGETIQSAWEFLAIEEPVRFEVLDSFVGDDGVTSEGFPSMRMTFAFAATPNGSQLTNTTYFTSADDLAKIVEMGAVEAASLAMNQLDQVLAGLRAFAAGKGTEVELLDDTRARTSPARNPASTPRPKPCMAAAHTPRHLSEALDRAGMAGRSAIRQFADRNCFLTSSRRRRPSGVSTSQNIHPF